MSYLAANISFIFATRFSLWIGFFRIDGGKDFGSTKTLGTDAGATATPQIAVSGRNVYVVWSDNSPGGNVGIFFKRSTNNGANFGSLKQLSNNDRVADPQIAVSGRNVYVVWAGGSPDGIFFKRGH